MLESSRLAPPVDSAVIGAYDAASGIAPGATVDNRVDLFKSGPAAEWFQMVYAKAYERGGHFGPWEDPDAFIEGIRETFRILRAVP